MSEIAVPTLYRKRFVPSKTFPTRSLYPVAGHGNLGINDDGTLFYSSDDGPAQAFYVNGDQASVDKGKGAMGRTLFVSDAAVD